MNNIPSDMNAGAMHKSTLNGYVEVLRYINSDNVLVRFINTGYEGMFNSRNIRSGQIKDKLDPVVYGVGFVGIGSHKTKTQAHSVWKGMLERCYCEKSKIINPTYAECYVDEAWHNLQNFSDWYNKNRKNDGKKYQLDKDLLFVGNKKYSQSTCLLIPCWLNTFALDSMKARGEHKIGVCYDKQRGKFQAGCKLNGKRIALGRYDNEDEAHQAWVEFKLGIAKSRKCEMDSIDERIYGNIVKIITSHTA